MATQANKLRCYNTDTPPIEGAVTLTGEQRAKARRTVAANALDEEDLAHLLDVLGLWPTEEETEGVEVG